MSKEKISGPLAVEILTQWKNDDGTLREKHGDLTEYAVQYELEKGWAKASTREEFGDQGTYEAWIRYRHLHKATGATVSTVTQNDYNLESGGD